MTRHFLVVLLLILNVVPALRVAVRHSRSMSHRPQMIAFTPFHVCLRHQCPPRIPRKMRNCSLHITAAHATVVMISWIQQRSHLPIWCVRCHLTCLQQNLSIA
ncbi:hypothetical protein B0H10DRAFT_2108330 [Mycena sp. CBHHK59/15]|nr:hypothetical protein B0H10DRAFT_2108330 [Mycena sp. CBHHK59/15]